MRQVIILLCITAACQFYANAQDCSVYSLSLPGDTTICQPGAPVSLDATFTGTISSLSWSPETGLNFPTILNPTATANTTTTYTLTVQAVAPENLIVNGDFSMGDTGFLTDYQYGNGGEYGTVSDEGDYAIDDNTIDAHSNFVDCGDHTGGGNMMIVNGSGQPDDIWCQNVSVQTNTLYNFSAWVMNAIAENPPNLQFSINGVLLGEVFDATISTCVWQQFAESWFSGSTTNALICVVNVNEELDGNDFALDDIGFSPVCTYTDEITITVGAPPAAPVVDCESTTSTISLSWPDAIDVANYSVNVLNAPPGIFTSDTSYLVSGLTPDQLIDFEVIANGSNGCSTSNSLSCMTLPCPDIQIDMDSPNAICEGEDLTFDLTITGSATGVFEVSFSNGVNIINFNNIPLGTTPITISPPASFNLELTALTITDAPNCIVSNLPTPISIAVNEQPTSGVGNSFAGCNEEGATISLNDLLQSADPGGNWFDISSNSAGDAFDSAEATVDLSSIAAGQYTFEYSITAPLGCSDVSTSVNVEVFPTPTADAGEDMTINCTTSEVNLGGANTSTDAGLIFNWNVIEGGPLSSQDSPINSTTTAGIYSFEVIEPLNNCSSIDTVIVDEQITSPEVFAQVIPSADCADGIAGSILVDSVMNAAAPLQYSINGSPYSSDNQFNNLDGGIYNLSVIDDNGCEGSTTLQLEESSELFVDIAIQSASGSNRIIAGESVDLQAIINIPAEEITSIVWSPNPDTCTLCTQITVSPLNTQVYQLSVTDVNGCTVTTSVSIIVEQVNRYFIPNAFSPNDDGRNDLFSLFTGPELVEVESMIVVDRWGNMVYQRENFTPNDPGIGWDGSFNGEPMNPGVYVYAVIFKKINGEEVKASGTVNLIR
jgi:gliding motility-associated-like protein